MKHRMWPLGVNPLVILGSIPVRALGGAGGRSSHLSPSSPPGRDGAAEKISASIPTKRVWRGGGGCAEGLGVPVLTADPRRPWSRTANVMAYSGWAGLQGDPPCGPRAAARPWRSASRCWSAIATPTC
jgi:hypothetical protein